MWYVAIGGLLLGVALKVLVPYLRAGLEDVAETGSFKMWPVFDWRYLAMFLLPVLEFGVAFLITPGLWAIVASWSFITACAFGYSGSDLGKEAIKAGAAVLKLSR